MYSEISAALGFYGSHFIYDAFIFIVCGVMLIMLTYVFIDLIYRIFAHFWR